MPASSELTVGMEVILECEDISFQPIQSLCWPYLDRDDQTGCCCKPRICPEQMEGWRRSGGCTWFALTASRATRISNGSLFLTEGGVIHLPGWFGAPFKKQCVNEKGPHSTRLTERGGGVQKLFNRTEHFSKGDY